MRQKRTVLITGVGSPGAPGVIQSLRLTNKFNFHLIGVDANRTAVGAAMVDRFYVIPEATKPAFIPSLLQICNQESVQVLLPMVTAELIPLARHSSEFLHLGCTVSISSPKALEISVYKDKLFSQLSRQGFPLPEFRNVSTADGLLDAIGDLGFPHRPVCFKPIRGDGSRGFHRLDSSSNPAADFFSAKADPSLVSLDGLKDLLRKKPDIPQLLVMEYLPGLEYSVDLLVHHGKVLVAIPRRRKTVVNGITIQGTIEHEPDVMLYATAIAEQLKLHGNIGVQVRRDAKGVIKLLEVNPRLQGTVVHCTGAGVNLPLLAVQLALGMPIAQSQLQINWGTRLQRYWAEVFFTSDGSPYQLSALDSSRSHKK